MADPSDPGWGQIGPAFDSAMQNAGLQSKDRAIPKYPFDPEEGSKIAQQRRWEHKIVGLILEHFGIEKESAVLAEMAKEKTGLRRLSFELFHSIHPSFPLWLTASKVPYVHKLTMEDFIKRFTKTSLYQRFAEAESQSPTGDEGSSGLVFEWLHVWPIAIIHNRYRGIKKAETAVFHQFPGTGQLMAIQSFSSFLDTLPWSP